MVTKEKVEEEVSGGEKLSKEDEEIRGKCELRKEVVNDGMLEFKSLER